MSCIHLAIGVDPQSSCGVSNRVRIRVGDNNPVEKGCFTTSASTASSGKWGNRLVEVEKRETVMWHTAQTGWTRASRKRQRGQTAQLVAHEPLQSLLCRFPNLGVEIGCSRRGQRLWSFRVGVLQTATATEQQLHSSGNKCHARGGRAHGNTPIPVPERLPGARTAACGAGSGVLRRASVSGHFGCYPEPSALAAIKRGGGEGQEGGLTAG